MLRVTVGALPRSLYKAITNGAQIAEAKAIIVVGIGKVFKLVRMMALNASSYTTVAISLERLIGNNVFAPKVVCNEAEFFPIMSSKASR